MSSEFNGDFAKLTPRNLIAQRLFSKAYAYVEQDDAFHLSFMKCTSGEQLSGLDEPIESSTEYDTHLDTDAEHYDARRLQNTGCFILSLHKQRAPEKPHLGWRAGRGSSKFANRNVDLLLAKPGDNMGKSLASIHMIFQFHTKSGFLMLLNGSEKVLVEHNIGGSWKELAYLERQLMFSKSAIIRAGQCEFELEHTLNVEQRDSYLYMRDSYINDLLDSNNTRLYPPLQILPGDICVQRGRYIEFETRGHGTFGWINQGVDTKTGDIVAIKELRIKNHLDRKEVSLEVDIGRRFHVSQVLFQLHSYLTSYSMNGVFFQFWRRCANMAMSTVVQIGKKII
ncbi:hypothetical protein MMC11_003272 [Xylographa trunciseda]|nr:hypothetical protein [Xylographa trunciseda]